jgi:hypothetical protein
MPSTFRDSPDGAMVDFGSPRGSQTRYSNPRPVLFFLLALFTLIHQKYKMCVLRGICRLGGESVTMENNNALKQRSPTRNWCGPPLLRLWDNHMGDLSLLSIGASKGPIQDTHRMVPTGMPMGHGSASPTLNQDRTGPRQKALNKKTLWCLKTLVQHCINLNNN